MELPDQAGQQLLRKAGDKVRLLTAGRVKSVVLRAVEPLTIELGGQVITVDQWAVFTVPLEQAKELLEQFPAQLERLDLPPDPPAEPLQSGWLVAYRDHRGQLRGGCDEREAGTVAACQWDGRGWTVLLTNKDTLRLSQIVSVGNTDQDGRIVAAWNVRAHGYDGEGSDS